MHRERKRRRLIMFSLVMVLMLMIGGYAAFQSKLDIKGSTKVTTNWEVLITNVTPGTPTGNAENSKDENDNVILPTWDGLSASMSADLYEAGDSMEYIVTITNRGNLDAVLDNIDEANAASNHSEAVIITYSGYAEKQKLRRNSSMDIKVKVEYNPEYTGGEVTGSSNITFSFKEASSKLDNDNNPIIENDTVISKDDKTITYDCEENGGTGNQTSIFDVGSPVDLGVQCTKEGYQFLGWNTDKNATTVLDSYTMSNEDKTLYGIYKKDITVTYNNTAYEINTPKTYNAGESDDTGIILDWDNDFTIEETINVSTSGQRYLLIGNYDNSTNLQLNIEINALNQLRVYFQKNLNFNKCDGTISFGEDINVKFMWDASEQKYYITAKGENTNISFDGKPDFEISGKSAKSLLVGYKDNRSGSSPFNEITVKSLKYGNNQDDTCTIYNKTTSCDFAVPNAVLNNDLDNDYYELDGWYIGDTKIENPGSNHTYTDSVTVEAKVKNLSVMMSGPNFQTTIDSVKSTVTEIEFIDLDDTSLTVPTIGDNNTWDVSAKQNGSVIAWLDGTKMYIGGKGGAIGNSDSSYLFHSFTNATSIEFSNYFDTSIVTNMRGMFGGDSHWILLDLSNFDTSNVTNMQSMFTRWNGSSASWGVSYLTDIIFGENFVTNNVIYMSDMFSGQYFENLNLSNFDTSKVKGMYHMFNQCVNLKTIYVSENFVTTNVTNSTSMFGNNTNLVGGNGTAFADKLTTDATYALIDKSGQEGYFTDGSYPVIRNVSSVSTTNSITLTVDAWIPSGDEIQTIEYSIDGDAWQSQTNPEIAGNIYKFTGLPANTNHTISVRVTSENGKVTTKNYEYTTSLTAPTYTETGDDKITITYPNGCGSELICTYKIDNGDEEPVSSGTTVEVTYEHAGVLTGYVKDKDTNGTVLNTVSSTYNLTWSDLYIASPTGLYEGSDEDGYGTLDKPYATMNKAYQSAKDTSTIYIMDDITTIETTNFNSNKDIMLTSCTKNGNTCSYSSNNSVIRGNSLTAYVINESSGELALENITIDGNNVEARSSMIRFASNATIEEGTIIKNAVSNYDNGAALRIMGGTSIIDGGEISNNRGISNTNSRGGGIFVATSSQLIINSGQIKNNSSVLVGGGIYTSSASNIISIYGGEISGNTASSGGGIYVNNNSSLIMSGGKIQDNTATTNGGGIFATGSGTVTISQAAGKTTLIDGNEATNGGGLSVIDGKSLTVSGGTISDNTATTSGGGIYATGNGTVTISGTALIDGNQTTGNTSSNPSYGAGLWVGNGKTFNMIGGTVSNNYSGFCGGGISLTGGESLIEHTISGGMITGNEAANNSGGILLDDSEAKLTMTGGMLSNNQASSTGGIFVYGGSTFELDGGTIKNNIATNSIGGIRVNTSNNSTFTYKSGVICANTPLNLNIPQETATCPS